MMLFYVRPKSKADVSWCLFSPSSSPQGKKECRLRKKKKTSSNSLSGQTPTAMGGGAGEIA